MIAARSDWRTDLDDLVAYGQCVVVDQRLLRFDIDETLQLVQARAGARIDAASAPACMYSPRAGRSGCNWR